MDIIMKTKGLFFDLGWTLCYPNSDHWMFPKKCYEYIDPTLLSSLPKDRRESALAVATKYLDDNHLILTEDEEYEQFRLFYRIFSDALPELRLSAQSIDEIAYDKVYNPDNYLFFDDVKPSLERLKSQYRLGVISDTWPSIVRVLKNFGIYHLFDTFTFSYNFGVYKPDPKMYEHALGALGLPPAETIFVDDLPKNLDGAKAHKITPVLIKRKNDSRVVPAHSYQTITSLTQL